MWRRSYWQELRPAPRWVVGWITLSHSVVFFHQHFKMPFTCYDAHQFERSLVLVSEYKGLSSHHRDCQSFHYSPLRNLFICSLFLPPWLPQFQESTKFFLSGFQTFFTNGPTQHIYNRLLSLSVVLSKPVHVLAWVGTL